MIDFAAQYSTLEAFLSDVAITGDFTGETCVDGPEEQLFVTLSTVHQAKGLEWPVVIIPWVSDGRFPTDLAVDPQDDRTVFITFGGFGTWSKDKDVHQVSVHISTAEDEPYVGIQVDGGTTSNVNTKPEDIEATIPLEAEG